jgi:hypothetical protein
MELTDREVIEIKESKEVDDGVTIEERRVNLTYRVSGTQKVHRRGWPETVVIDAAGNELRPRRHRDNWLKLLSRCDGVLPITASPHTIPTKLVALGKPEIAVYLRIAHNCWSPQIAELLNVSRSTCNQYVSDFGAGRR